MNLTSNKMVEAEPSSSNGKFKLHLNSNLIRTDSSTLPDELKNLGVCAYDERTFEKGLLDQMDLQIAEYNHINNNDSSESDQEPDVNQNTKQNGLKRKIAPVNNNGKKARTSTEDLHPEDANLDEFNEELNGISYSPLMDEEDNDSNIEQMIKNGEMTPFGTVVNFEKSSIKGQEAKKPNPIKQTKSKIVIHKIDQSNEFDTFLMDLDKKTKPKLVKKKPMVT